MMKNNRSAPQVIGRDVGIPDDAQNGTNPGGQTSDTVTKPVFQKRKKKHGARPGLSIPADEPSDPSEDGPVVTAKRSIKPASSAQSQPFQKKSIKGRAALVAQEHADSQPKPDYSFAALRNLQSTNNEPGEVSNTSQANRPREEDIVAPTQSLDLSSKFGSNHEARYAKPTAVPGAAEIAEKKARRARLAMQEQAAEYISLDPETMDDYDMNEDNSTVDAAGRLVPKSGLEKYGKPEGRLGTNDDEDMMEGFEQMEDPRLALGDSAEKAAERKRRQEMATLIADAEGDEEGSENSDDSERERMEAYEATQTRHATGASGVIGETEGVRAPPKISPLPTLDSALQGLRQMMAEMKAEQAAREKEMEGLRLEKLQIADDEKKIQAAIRERAEYYDNLRKEKGIEAPGTAVTTSEDGAPMLAPTPAQQYALPEMTSSM